MHINLKFKDLQHVLHSIGSISLTLQVNFDCSLHNSDSLLTNLYEKIHYIILNVKKLIINLIN